MRDRLRSARAVPWGRAFGVLWISQAVQAVMTELTPPERRGAAFGLLTMASAVGSGAGPVLGSAIAAAYGIPAVFVATAPLFVLCAASLLFVRMLRAQTA